MSIPYRVKQVSFDPWFGAFGFSSPDMFTLPGAVYDRRTSKPPNGQNETGQTQLVQNCDLFSRPRLVFMVKGENEF